MKSRGLGRGLSTLMADVKSDISSVDSVSAKNDRLIAIESIFPNPDQPRKLFSEDALNELASSIREKGIIQPLIVREKNKDEGTYEIVAGERRWRAAQLARLHEVPVVIREFTDTEVLEVAIIENIQRADLNAIDEAEGYKQLMDRFGHTQEQVSSALGKSRSHIANHLRLLNLPSDVLSFVRDGLLTSGHARTLVGSENASDLARDIMRRKLSVRETERLIKNKNSAKPRAKSFSKAKKDADTLQIESELSLSLGMKVNIDHRSGAEEGRLVLNYQSLEQLDDLLRLLSSN